jgi:hypothetical protein
MKAQVTPLAAGQVSSNPYSTNLENNANGSKLTSEYQVAA